MLSSFIFLSLISWSSAAGRHKLIAIIVDGFRHDYFDAFGLELKGFPKMIAGGMKAEHLNPIYPSVTYVNVGAFLTGNYPDKNNFYDNMMWDSESDTFFLPPAENYTDLRWWTGAEPIYATAQRNQLTTAVYWLIGDMVEAFSHQPSIVEDFRYSEPTDKLRDDFKERIDRVLDLFARRKTASDPGLDFALFYYGSVDYTGHYNGVGSPEMRKAITDIDEVVDYIQEKIHSAGLDDKVNIVIASDHGMSNVVNSTFISLEKYAPDIRYMVNAGPTCTLVPEHGKLDKLYNDMISDNIEGLHVYRQQDIPEYYHIKHSRFIGPIVLHTDTRYFVLALNDSSKRKGDTLYSAYAGEHGYNPDDNKDMKGIFLAKGPDFKKGLVFPAPNITDLYNVMCHVLKIPPSPNVGRWSHVKDIFAYRPRISRRPPPVQDMDAWRRRIKSEVSASSSS